MDFSIIDGAQKLETTKRKTKPYASSYEYCALISYRAAQLQNRMESTKPKVKIDPNNPLDFDPLYIAEKEVKEKLATLMILRHLPDGTYEDFTLQELILPRL